MAYQPNPMPHAPTYMSTGTDQPAPNLSAGSASIFSGGSAMDPISAGIGAAGSILGGLFSGQRQLNNANTKILKELLAQFQANQPIRQGIQTSLLGRLPGYMQGNFNVPTQNPTVAALAAQLGRGHKMAPQSTGASAIGQMPSYGGAPVAGPGGYPTFPGFNTSAMGEWKP